MTAVRVRPAAVAGRFYTGDGRALRAEVEALLAQVAPHVPRLAAPPAAIVVPHAALAYSGPVAAHAWACAAAAGVYQRVVLAGPAHYVDPHGMALCSADAWATPLGVLRCDGDLRARLAACPGVVVDDRPHRPEHALEVQLPFVQVALGDVAVVGLVVGRVTPEEVAGVFETVFGEPGTLVVVSTDLSHYHPHDVAQRLDAATALQVEHCDTGLGAQQACGVYPLAGLLEVCRRHDVRPRRLALSDSAATGGPIDRVVGYGAWAVPAPGSVADRAPAETAGEVPAAPVGLLDPEVSAPPAPPPPPVALPVLPEPLDARQRGLLLGLAEAVVAAELRTPAGRPPSIELHLLPPRLLVPEAVFVTLERDGRLLGCVGSIEPVRPLGQAVATAAWQAAFDDPRLPSVRPEDFPELSVKISVLGPLVAMPAAGRSELLAHLRPGVDGLVLRAGRRRATFLPSVWRHVDDPERFVSMLLAKAGLDPDRWPVGLRAERYVTLEFGDPGPRPPLR